MTRTFAVFGSGGVGKTTTSAALSVALAQAGQRTLVTTLDPARRLADVLGAPPGRAAEIHPVAGRPGLFMSMPEAGASARGVAATLLRNHPDALRSLADNPVFEMLCGGLAGVHELASLADLADRFADFDAVVIDTAPSRHGVELLSLPRRLQQLVDGRALRWLGELSRERLEERRGLGRLIGWGKRRFVAGFERSLGSTVVADTMEVLDAVALVRQELSATVAAAERMLCGPDVARWLVLAPAMGGVDRAIDLAAQIRATSGRRVDTLVLNRATAEVPAWPRRLSLLEHLGEHVVADARAANDELADSAQRTRDAELTLADAVPDAARLRVPSIDAGATPPAVVDAAAAHLARQAKALAPCAADGPLTAEAAAEAAAEAVFD